MNQKAFVKIAELARKSDAITASVSYLAEKLHFLRSGERVLILFPGKSPEQLGTILGEAVRQQGAEPIWVEDYRWITLLRTAFSEHVSTIIGPPLIVLGLSKLAKYRGIPLGIRNVVIASYPCVDWMIEGINKGFDCTTWGCFDPGDGALICGFSCGKSRGVHLREAEYTFQIMDDNDNVLSDGEVGQVVIGTKAAKKLSYRSKVLGRLEQKPCTCGDATSRLLDISTLGHSDNKDVSELAEYLHSWTSVLDCSVKRGPYGIELEMVIFPGEKLPKLPSCAKQVVRPWNPETDKPFHFITGLNDPIL